MKSINYQDKYDINEDELNCFAVAKNNNNSFSEEEEIDFDVRPSKVKHVIAATERIASTTTAESHRFQWDTRKLC